MQQYTNFFVQKLLADRDRRVPLFLLTLLPGGIAFFVFCSGETRLEPDLPDHTRWHHGLHPSGRVASSVHKRKANHFSQSSLIYPDQ